MGLIGKAIRGIGSATINMAAAVGTTAYKTGKIVGSATKTAATAAGKATVKGSVALGKDLAVSTIKGDARSPIVMMAKLGYKGGMAIGKRSVKIGRETATYNAKTGKTKIEDGIRVTKFGIGAAGIMAGAVNFANSDGYVQSRQGTVSPDKVTATPSFEAPQYDIAGATGTSGDLVFALKANSQGGYL